MNSSSCQKLKLVKTKKTNNQPDTNPGCKLHKLPCYMSNWSTKILFKRKLPARKCCKYPRTLSEQEANKMNQNKSGPLWMLPLAVTAGQLLVCCCFSAACLLLLVFSAAFLLLLVGHFRDSFGLMMICCWICTGWFACWPSLDCWIVLLLGCNWIAPWLGLRRVFLFAFGFGCLIACWSTQARTIVFFKASAYFSDTYLRHYTVRLTETGNWTIFFP